MFQEPGVSVHVSMDWDDEPDLLTLPDIIYNKRIKLR